MGGSIESVPLMTDLKGDTRTSSSQPLNPQARPARLWPENGPLSASHRRHESAPQTTSRAVFMVSMEHQLRGFVFRMLLIDTVSRMRFLDPPGSRLELLSVEAAAISVEP